MRKNSARPAWSDGHERARVLIECASADSPEVVADVVGRQGVEVAVCTGPGDGVRCPLLHDGACELVDGADVVVNLLASDDGHRIATSVMAQRRPAEMVYEVRLSETRRNGLPPGDAELIRTPVTQDGLLRAVSAALSRAAPQGGPVWGPGV